MINPTFDIQQHTIDIFHKSKNDHLFGDYMYLDFAEFIHNLRMKYIDSKSFLTHSLNDTQTSPSEN